MGKSTGLLTGKVSGKVGQVIFVTRNGEQIVQAYQPTVKNPKTSGQMMQRVKWPNIVAVHAVLANYIANSFATVKKSNQSNFNYFMAANLARPAAYLRKEQHAAGASIPAPYLIAKGTLIPIEVSIKENVPTSNIALGSLDITATTTVAALSEAIVSNNTQFAYGDQISYYALLATESLEDGISVPRARLVVNELVLSRDNTAQLNGLTGFASVGGFLAGVAITEGSCACYVHSRRSSSKLLVSTQALVMNGAIIQGDEAALNESMASYGYDGTTVFLDPNVESVGSTGGTGGTGGGGGGGNDDEGDDEPGSGESNPL